MSQIGIIDPLDLAWWSEDLADVFAVCCADGSLRLFENAQGIMTLQVPGVTSLCWPRNADYIVGSTNSGNVLLVQLVDSRCMEIHAHLAAITSLSLCPRLDPPVFASAGLDGNAFAFRTHSAYAHDALGRRVVSRLNKPASYVCGTLATYRLASGRNEPLLAVGSRIGSLAASGNDVVNDWSHDVRRKSGVALTMPKEIGLNCAVFGYAGVDLLDAANRNVTLLTWPLGIDYKIDLLPGHQVPPTHGPVRHYEWAATAGKAGAFKVCRLHVDCSSN